MIYWQLFKSFFIIGLFCFGGGYAILPFIQTAVIENNWLSMKEFGDIIAVAESTPGPVSINTATFVGFKLAGIPGAACATFSLCLPAYLLVLTVVKLLYTKHGELVMNRLLVGIRPVVIGMIFYAAWVIGDTVFKLQPGQSFFAIHFIALGTAVAAFLMSLRFKTSPIIIIVLSALIGVFSGLI